METTSKTEIEEEFSKSEDCYRALFNNSRDGIAIADLATGELLDCNQALCDMVERKKEELTGRPHSILHPSQELVEGQSSSYRKHCSENADLIIEDSLLSVSGKVIPVEIRAAKASIGGRDCIFGIFRDITERRHAEASLKETIGQLESWVQQRTLELEETNTAMRILLRQGNDDNRRMEENLQSNINQLVTPFIEKLRRCKSETERETCINILESNLNNIVSPFINQLSASFQNMTPKEIQIAEMIKQGKNSKEIAELFGVSKGTVITHRNKIRKKLALESRNVNLRSHLLSMV